MDNVAVLKDAANLRTPSCSELHHGAENAALISEFAKYRAHQGQRQFSIRFRRRELKLPPAGVRAALLEGVTTYNKIWTP
jgi:hypothetical protein